MTLGTLGAMVEYSNNIVWPMEMLGWLTNSFSSAIASNRKIKKIYNQKPTVEEKECPVILDEIKGKVEFSDVSYSRDGENNIIEDINFVVEPGKTLGIMGETGSGKTTIINLMSRMYDVTSGKISLDNVDIRDMKLSQIRESIAPVMQDVFLFSDTISENVKLGKKKYIDELQVIDAAKSARVDEFAEKVQNKYDTVIGERGGGLSIGQKQLLALARTMVSKPKILILDEATSGIDTKTELLVQEGIASLLKGRTSFVIAHRLSTIKKADRIFVINSGKIVEEGNHEQLLRNRGAYYKLYMEQFKQARSCK